MSVKISAMVFEAGPEDLAQHSVMIALADNADDNGVAWPGQELLARKSRMSPRNLIRVLAALEREGWLVRRQRCHGEHRRGSVYELNMARLGLRVVTQSIPDTVSLHARKRAVKTDTSAPPHDTVSPQDKLPAREVTSEQREVTTSASRGDMGLADLLLSQRDVKQNHHEPPIEPSTTPCNPPQAGDGISFGSRPPRGDGESNGRPVVTGAARRAAAIGWQTTRVMRECGFAENPRLEQAISDALDLRCLTAKCEPVEAGELAIRNVKLFIENRKFMSHGWGWKVFFRDGYWRDDSVWPYDKRAIDQLRQPTWASIGVCREK